MVDQFDATDTAAAALDLPLASLELRDPPYDYAQALADADGRRGDALLVMTSPFFFRDRAQLAELALQHRLPSVFVLREHTEAGGLMSYAPRLTGMYQRAADYVDRIAKGARPAEARQVKEPLRGPEAVLQTIRHIPFARRRDVPAGALLHRPDPTIDATGSIVWSWPRREGLAMTEREQELAAAARRPRGRPQVRPDEETRHLIAQAAQRMFGLFSDVLS